MIIDDRVAGWRDVVPAALARAAATAICGNTDGPPCESCVGEAAGVLAYAYAYNDRASEDQPCLACELVRENQGAIYANCLFHMGLYQGVTSGLEPPEPAPAPDPDPTLPVSIRTWRWRYLALAVIVAVTAIYVAIGVFLTVKTVGTK